MGIRPLLSALTRNRTGPVLVALQAALTLAILVNAVYVIVQRTELMNRPTGMDVPNLFWVVSTGYVADLNYASMVQADLELLNSTPGVAAATVLSAVPLSSSGTSQTYYTQAGQKGRVDSTVVYLTNERALQTFGLKLVAGRMFDRSVVPPVMSTSLGARERAGAEVVITQALSQKLFPDGNALGQFIYGRGDVPTRIVGIVEHMLGPWPEQAFNNHVMLIPAVVASATSPSVTYLVRTQPGRRDELIGTVQTALEKSEPGRIIAKIEALEETYSQTLTGARSSVVLLGIVVVLVSLVTILGVSGLAIFNVTARTKQIGIRRALGARRIDILRYFLFENWLVTTAGVLVGSAAALAIGMRLSLMFQSPRLPLYYLLGGVFAMWILGLAATLIPARRAAAVSPAVATRSV